jgi:ribA/ribD-fused uncharacterized protein
MSSSTVSASASSASSAAAATATTAPKTKTTLKTIKTTKASPAATATASPATATKASPAAAAAVAAPAAPTPEFVALSASVTALQQQFTELSGRLETALGLLSTATATATTSSKSKKTAEPKEKKTKAAKAPKEKKTCPEAAEGVVRFSSSAGTSPHRIYSPLYKQAFTVDDKEFPTVEHYAQYKKFIATDPEYAESLLDKAPATLRMAGKTKAHEADPAYNMEEAYRFGYSAQIAQHEEFKAALLATGEAKIEAEYPADDVLGIGEDGTGENLLGFALMALRTASRA